MEAARRNKIIAIALLIVIVIAAGAAAYMRYQSNKRQYEAHYAKAIQFEKEGRFQDAIRELKKASAFVAVNDTETKRALDAKIAALQRRASQTSDGNQASAGGSSSSSQNSSGSQSPPGSSTGSTATPSTVAATLQPPVELPSDLSQLLPASFLKLAGTIASSKSSCSVRFDDVDTPATYIAYVYALESPKAAYDHAYQIVSMGFPKNRTDLDLQAPFSGVTGYYGENDQGDAMLAFAYAQLAYECLVRSDTLSSGQKKSQLIELQKALKKP